MGERFVAAAREANAPGIIGPFALQCIIVAGPPKEFVCYDVSLRIPGSPGTRYTPYSAYRWGRDVSVGERIAMELGHGKRCRSARGDTYLAYSRMTVEPASAPSSESATA